VTGEGAISDRDPQSSAGSDDRERCRDVRGRRETLSGRAERHRRPLRANDYATSGIGIHTAHLRSSIVIVTPARAVCGEQKPAWPVVTLVQTHSRVDESPALQWPLRLYVAVDTRSLKEAFARRPTRPCRGASALTPFNCDYAPDAPRCQFARERRFYRHLPGTAVGRQRSTAAGVKLPT
jgi:hypothetical protein